MSDDSIKVTEILTFFISGKPFGIWPNDLLEIVEDHNYVPVPNAPDFLKGIINSHGRVFSVIDLTELMKEQNLSLGAPRRIAILKNDDFMIGILVPSSLSITLYHGSEREGGSSGLKFFKDYIIGDGSEEVKMSLLETEEVFGYLREYFKKRSIIAI